MSPTPMFFMWMVVRYFEVSFMANLISLLIILEFLILTQHFGVNVSANAPSGHGIGILQVILLDIPMTDRLHWVGVLFNV